MSIFESVILGLIQGLTEFLPISSSGHLIVVRKLLSLPLENTLAFDVLLHLATLLAIIIYFWGDLKRIAIDAKSEGLSSRSSKLIYAIIVGTIPAILFGYYFADKIENAFRTPEHVAYMLLAGSVVFFLADRLSKVRGGINPARGFFIGMFQALAIIPGLSRSGLTISGGLFLGLSREEAIRFAFLLGIPVILGAAIKTFLDLSSSDSPIIYNLLSINSLVGFLAAFFSGLCAVRFLVRYLSTHSFTPFIIYRIVLAIIILLFL